MSDVLFISLFNKYLDGVLSLEETESFQGMLQNSSYQDLFDRLLKTEVMKDHAGYAGAGLAKPDELFNRIVQGESKALGEQAVIRKLKPMYPLRWWMAAAILIGVCCTMTWYFWYAPRATNPAIAQSLPKASDVIAPGRQGAILTLGDGSSLQLDSLGNGVVARRGGTQMTLHNGQLQYAHALSGKGDQPLRTATEMHTLTTPRGRHFRIVLPDGTHAWLNAASSITYPAVFTGTDRKVSVEGEVYFDVAQQKNRPFRVMAGKQLIEVLGTQFNIKAYTNEDVQRTTLLQGSIAIHPSGDSTNRILLKPGEQLQVSGSDGKRAVHTIEPDQVLAWKDGLFCFRDADIKTVMRDLERWYDITVRYKGNVTSRSFQGKIQRDLSLPDLLFGLQRSDVHFNIEGRTLTILP